MIESDMSAWDRNEKGEIEIEPVLEWAVGAMPNNVLLRLEILTETGQIAWAQLRLPADQAAELGESIRWMAKRAQAGPTEGQA